MLDQAIEMLENMSEEELEVLMNTEFPEGLEKQASEEIAKNDLFEGLYAYGANMAIMELEAEEELDKTASEQAVEDDSALSEFIEEKVFEAGLLNNEDEVALHKTAQVAAAYLFAGYADELTKEAAKSKKTKDKGYAARLGNFVKKHKGKAAIGAGVAALGTGAYLAKRHMDKKASELTVSELTAEVLHNEQIMNMIVEDLEKCAAKGKAKGKAAKGMFDSAVKAVKGYGKSADKWVKANPYKAAGGAAATTGAAGGLAGYMAGKRKEKED